MTNNINFKGNDSLRIFNNVEFLFDDYVLNEGFISFDAYLISKGFSKRDNKIIKEILKLRNN